MSNEPTPMCATIEKINEAVEIVKSLEKYYSNDDLISGIARAKKWVANLENATDIDEVMDCITQIQYGLIVAVNDVNDRLNLNNKSIEALIEDKDYALIRDVIKENKKLCEFSKNCNKALRTLACATHS